MEPITGGSEGEAIVDASKARDADSSFRILRVVFLGAASQSVFVAAVLGIEKRVSPVVAVVIGVVGVFMALFQLVLLERRRRLVLSRFVEPISGELAIPGEPRLMPRRMRVWLVVLVVAEILAIAVLAATHG